MDRRVVALAGAGLLVAAAVLWTTRAPGPPTSMRALLDRLGDEGVDCRLRGEVEHEDTSMFGGEIAMSIDRAICLLQGAEVSFWAFGTAEQKDAHDEEDVSGHGHNWFVNGETWSANTPSESAARAIHEVLGGHLEPPGT